MSTKSLAFGPFVLDRERRMLTRKGEPVPISHRGYILLEILLDAGGEPVSKEALMERCWPHTVIEESNLSVQISTLRRQLGNGADAIIVTVPRVGYRLVAQTGRDRPGYDRGAPLVAVLPFANHGSVAEDGYFADGVVDDIITALSRFRTFGVLSRGSSFALRDRGVDARGAASELGIRYALEGSIRRMSDRLRVSAQLLDVTSGAELWAERYEGSVADIFSFQDRITDSVVGVIEPTIRKAEIQRARRKPAASLDAYDLFLRALPLIYAPGPAGYAEAIALLSQSAEADPSFALPRAYAAWVYEKRISLRLPTLGSDDHDACISMARAALELGGDDPLVRAICGFVLYRVARDISALAGLRQAAEENPNNVVILNLAGAGNMMAGAAGESYKFRARAYELSPGAPDDYVILHGMGAAEMMLGHYEAAIEWCLKSLATFNDWQFTYLTLTTCYEKLGRMDEATAMVRRLRELNPRLTMAAIEEGVDRCDDAYGTAVIPSLRGAGLPER